jgi:hypothetical protein
MLFFGDHVHYLLVIRDYGKGKFLLILEDTRYRGITNSSSLAATIDTSDKTDSSSSSAVSCEGGCVFRTIIDNNIDMNLLYSVCNSLAKQHVAFWRNPPSTVWGYSPRTGLPNRNTPPVLRLLLEGGYASITKKYISTHKVTISDDVKELFSLLLIHFTKVRKFWSSGPLTLCHGDSHIGNFFFSKNLENAGYVDFQCLSAEYCLRDISYHMFNSYSVEMVEKNEIKVLSFYLTALQEEMKKKGKSQYLTDIPTLEKAMFYHCSYTMWVLTAWIVCCGLSDLVIEDFAIRSLQRIFDNCSRLNTLGVLKEIIKNHEKNVDYEKWIIDGGKGEEEGNKETKKLMEKN